MKPDWRKDWAKAWAGLIKPGGELVTLIFPVDPAKPRDEGPPFPVTVDLYNELLKPVGTRPNTIACGFCALSEGA